MNFYVVVDDSQAQALFNRLRQRIGLAGLRVFLRGTTRGYLVSRIVQRFASEGDEASGKWAELRESTALIRSYQGYGAWGPINQRTGALYRHVTSSYMLKAAGQGGMTLSIPGTNRNRELMSKLKVAQTGGFATTKPKGKRSTGPNRPAVPRPVLALSDTDQRVITTSLMAWIETS